jgi:hypothetical protein
MPRVVPVVGGSVIISRATVPIAMPVAVSPGAAHHRETTRLKRKHGQPATVPTISFCPSVAASDEGGSQPVFGSPRRQFHGHRCLTSFEVVAQFGPPAGICTSEDLLRAISRDLSAISEARELIHPSTPAAGIPVSNTELNLSARTLLKGGR